MKELIPLDINSIKTKDGIDFHDNLRDGISRDLDPIKVSAVIKAMFLIINDMASMLMEIAKQNDNKVRMKVSKKKRGRKKNVEKLTSPKK